MSRIVSEHRRVTAEKLASWERYLITCARFHDQLPFSRRTRHEPLDAPAPISFAHRFLFSRLTLLQFSFIILIVSIFEKLPTILLQVIIKIEYLLLSVVVVNAIP